MHHHGDKNKDKEKARFLGSALKQEGFRLVSGETDNHLLLVDWRLLGITSDTAEEALDSAGITVNKNTIPFDPQQPSATSVVRLWDASALQLRLWL